MALTRARVIAGSGRVARAGEQAIGAAIAIAGDRARIRADATAMRVRMLRELPPEGPWDVKPRPGGQIEVEFIAQVLQLLHPRHGAGGVQPDDAGGVAAAGRGRVLAPPDAAMLIRADHHVADGAGHAADYRWTGCRGNAAGGVGSAIAAGPWRGGFAGIAIGLEVLARDVRAAFVRYVGEVEKPAGGAD